MSDIENTSGSGSGTSEYDPGRNEQTPFVTVEATAEAAAASQAATANAAYSAGPASAYEAAPYTARPYAAEPGAPETGGSGTGGPGTGGPDFRAPGYPGNPPVGGWAQGTAGYASPPPPLAAGAIGSPSDPNPTAAFWLGLIPGVGAMYNGQVAKGFVHLIVFAVLVSIANAVNGVFGILVAGWIFFMAFEAYHTAKARREGLPLPNVFGWNDIGERVGLGRHWPFGPAGAGAASGPTSGPTSGPVSGSFGGAQAAGPPQPSWAQVPPAYPAPPYPAPPYSAPPYPAPPASPQGAPGPVGYGAAPNWAGYVPPSAFGSTPPPGSTGGAGTASGAAPGGAVPPGHGVPYVPVNAGMPYTASAFGADLPPAGSRLPVGAFWLIGLGLLFLLSQWTPLLQLSRVWIPSVLLGGLAVFLFARRMGWTGSSAWLTDPATPTGARVAGAVRVPGILLAIAVLNGLHEARVVRWDRSWPWLPIVGGVLLLVERVALRQAADVRMAADPAGKAGL